MSLGPPPASGLEAWSRCAVALRGDLDTLTDELCRLVLPLPSYIGVAETDLRPLVSAGLQSVLPAVIEGRPPSRGETTGYPEIIDSLAGLGVSLEDILQGWHLTHSVLRTWVRRQSPEEVATEIHGELEDLIYEWTSQGISVLVEAYRESQARSPQDAEQRQASFVRRVLLGDAAPAEIELHCRVHGLSPSGAFHALRAPAGTLRPVRSWLRLAGPTGQGGGLAAVVDGEIWGLTTGLGPREPEVPVGVSPPMAIWDLPRGFRLATRAMRTAIRLGLAGHHDVASLGVDVAVTDDNDLGDALRDRFVRPVQALGTTGDEILKTVRAFVSHQGHYERTARELYVHPNTVRYRIRRFEEVTSTELRTPPNMISAWWALERHRMLGESASD